MLLHFHTVLGKRNALGVKLYFTTEVIGSISGLNNVFQEKNNSKFVA